MKFNLFNFPNLSEYITNLMEARTFYIITGDNNGLAKVYIEMASLYLDSDQPHMAELYCKKALSLMKRSRNVHGQTYCVSFLGRIHEAQEHWTGSDITAKNNYQLS